MKFLNSLKNELNLAIISIALIITCIVGITQNINIKLLRNTLSLRDKEIYEYRKREKNYLLLLEQLDKCKKNTIKWEPIPLYSND